MKQFVLLAPFLLALGVRLTYLYLNGDVTLIEDSHQYLGIAHNLIEHGAFSLSDSEPFVPTIRRPLTYPLFLAILHILHIRTPFAIAATQAVLDSLCCLLILHLASQFVSRSWATCAAFFYAIFPGGLYLVDSVMSETLFTILLLSSVTLLIRAVGLQSRGFAIAAGLALGLTSLCRPLALPFAIVFCLIIFVHSQTGKLRYLIPYMLIACLSIVGPWAVRCTLLARSLVMAQCCSAVNFYLPSLSHIDQRDYVKIRETWYASDYGFALYTAKTPAEFVQADKIGFSITITNIKSNPRGYLSSRIRAFPQLFISSFGGATFMQCLREGRYGKLFIKLALLFIFSLLPFALAVVSLLNAKQCIGVAIIASVWLFTLLIHLPLWIEYRFWVPVMPLLIISALVGCKTTMAMWRQRRYQTT